MAKTKKLNALQHAEIFSPKLSKGQERQIAIIEAAIESYAVNGVDKTTYDSIAQICGVTRPLIRHYFKDRNEIFGHAVRYVRTNFQQIAIERIQAEKNPQRQLEAYIDSTFVWLKRFPTHALFWNLFYHYCGVDPAMKALNTELVEAGHQRIVELLRSSYGIKKDLDRKAKLIQILITGGLVTQASENHPLPDYSYSQMIQSACRAVLES